MNIDEMIEKLEEAKKSLGGEAEVMLATQPAWPMRYSIQGVALLGKNVICPDCEGYYMEKLANGDLRCCGPHCGSVIGADDIEKNDDNKVCWIVEGSQGRDTPYAPQLCWDSDNAL